MGSPVLLSLKHIKLSTRTALLFDGGLLMILGLSILLTWFFFLREINALELKATTETNRQAHQAILLKLSDMAQRSGDWAFWDETYKFSEIPSFFDTQIIPSVRVYKRCCFR